MVIVFYTFKSVKIHTKLEMRRVRMWFREINETYSYKMFIEKRDIATNSSFAQNFFHISSHFFHILHFKKVEHDGWTWRHGICWIYDYNEEKFYEIIIISQCVYNQPCVCVRACIYIYIYIIDGHDFYI